MHAGEQISEHAQRLSDEELVNRLRSGDFLDSATEAFRRELLSRGVDVDSVLAQVRVPQSSSASATMKSLTIGRSFLARAWKFPLRAVLGLEKPWAVVLYGGIALFAIFKIVGVGQAQLWELRPMPSYALPLAYTLHGCFAVAETWFCVALWRSASRLSSTLGKAVVLTLSAFLALVLVLGTANMTRFLQENFTSFPKSPL